MTPEPSKSDCATCPARQSSRAWAREAGSAHGCVTLARERLESVADKARDLLTWAILTPDVPDEARALVKAMLAVASEPLPRRMP